MTWGFSRDDVEASFFSTYLEHGVFAVSPFESLDIEGVGALVRAAAESGRAANPDLHLGICGEHGGDPASIHFFDDVGLDYVSCSPFRVPVARLEAGSERPRRATRRRRGRTQRDEHADDQQHAAGGLGRVRRLAEQQPGRRHRDHGREQHPRDDVRRRVARRAAS